MTVAGMSQYLTSVQGMPASVEAQLEKLSKSFMWCDKKAAINHEILYAPVEQGGKGLVSIASRNDAITLKILQHFLAFGPDRPVWAYFADRIYAKHVPLKPVLDRESRINPFTQTWSPLIAKLPKCLQTLYKAADTFGLKLDALAVDKPIKCGLPIWFHIGATKGLNKLNNSQRAKCLRKIHKVTTVEDMIDVVSQNHPNHKRRRNCACPPCKDDRG
ncbi:hypothetical protein DFH06DRAFT_990647 [Mycena polygramma]|nr:hypothetical protein DFH06DRAFT_990647 [Mycena polygramma]